MQNLNNLQAYLRQFAKDRDWDQFHSPKNNSIAPPTVVSTAYLIEKCIVLIDSETLTNLMVDYGLGVTTKHTVEFKAIDSDYFFEDEKIKC